MSVFRTQEGRAAICGGEVDYVAFGSGERALVMIPGLVLGLRGVKGSALSLALSYRCFAKDWRVYMFNAREELPEGFGVKDMADDLAAAMSSLGIKSADVLGVSQGGMVAQYLTLDHPELVSALVLAVTLSRPNPVTEGCVRRWIALRKKGARELMEDVFAAMYSERYMRRWGWMTPLLAASIKGSDADRFEILARACLSCDTYSRLGEIKAPTLVIGGGKDAVTTPEASRELAAGIGCELYMYDELGHSAYEEGRDFNGRVKSFLLGLRREQ